MKTKVILVLIVTLIVFSSIIGYCRVKENMDMYGKITKTVYDNQGKLKEIHIENISEKKKPYDKVVVLISEKTQFINGNVETSDLEQGQILGIIFKDGPITMIYPARVEAEVIRIEDIGAKTSTQNKHGVLSTNDNQLIIEKNRQELLDNYNKIITAMQNDINELLESSNAQKIHESNYGVSTQCTQVFNISDSEIQFDAMKERSFIGDFRGYYTAEKSYPYYLDAAMGGQRGLNVKDDFGVWHTFSYRVNIME